MMFNDILQPTLLANPLKLLLELLHFERFQSLDFFAFLKEFFLLTSFAAFSGFLTGRVLAANGGGEITWVTGNFSRVSVKRADTKLLDRHS